MTRGLRLGGDWPTWSKTPENKSGRYIVTIAKLLFCYGKKKKNELLLFKKPLFMAQ